MFLGAQKSHLIGMVLLSACNIYFALEIKLILDYTLLSKGLAIAYLYISMTVHVSCGSLYSLPTG